MIFQQGILLAKGNSTRIKICNIAYKHDSIKSIKINRIRIITDPPNRVKNPK